MIYFLWTLPAIAVVTVLASGRAGTFAASITGLIVALFIALTTAPFSPVRMSIVCSLAGTPGREREVYRAMLPSAAMMVVVLLIASILIGSRAF